MSTLDPLVASFETLDGAQAARSRLIEAGVDADVIETIVLADDRATTKGNFSVGNGDIQGTSPLSIGGVASYEQNFAKTETAGQCVLAIHVRDDDERRRISALLQPQAGA